MGFVPGTLPNPPIAIINFQIWAIFPKMWQELLAIRPNSLCMECTKETPTRPEGIAQAMPVCLCAKTKMEGELTMITLQEVESRGRDLWDRYCRGRAAEARQCDKPATFWVTCGTKGPVRPQEVFGARDPQAIQKIWGKFLAWADTQKDESTLPPVAVKDIPTTVPIEDGTVLNAIRSAVAKVPNLHPVAQEVLTCLLEGQNVYLWGPAGSGKSYLCQQVAGLLSEVIGKPIAFQDLQITGPNFSEIDYLVRIMPNEDGSLRSIPSPLVIGAKGDSLVLIDECDLATAEANVGGLNTPLASRRIYDVLAGQTIDMGENFFFIAAGNTDLNGPTPEYPSRCTQDGSFRSRFATSTFRIDYSEDLESKILDPRVAKLLNEGRKRIVGKGIQLELSTRVGANLTKSIRAGLRPYAQIVQRWLDQMDPTARQQAFPQGVN